MSALSTALTVRRDDVDFILFDWLAVDAEIGRETIDAFLDLSEKFAAEAFLDHYKASDTDEPRIENGTVRILPQIRTALSTYAALGFFSAGFNEKDGGLGLPYSACAASFAFFAAANVATSAYAMLTTANARLIITFGTEAQKQAFAARQVSGEWFGTMCISEPQAGSSLAEVRTRARADGSDALGERYRLFGGKMWISGGDHDASGNIVHLVLAKTEMPDGSLPDGTEGLSLFIVPKMLPDGSSNDVVVAGINHKMGYRGTANCVLAFGEGSGAIGWMVGAPGEGLRQMFLMMNEARIGVGLGAAALGYRSHLLSVDYARERTQGRLPGEKSGAPVPIIAHPDVRRMLLQQKAYVEGALALCLLCASLVDRSPADAHAAALLGLLTPVAKTWSSEYGLAANDIAIQIHGGYGYTRDFDVEQLWRDNRLNPIHEGTTGIQAIDLVGRKILREGGGLGVLDDAIRAVSEQAAAIASLHAMGEQLVGAWADMTAAIATLRACPERALDNATPFLWAFGHVVVAWIWLDQTLAACNATARTEDFREGKLRACQFFFESELPKVDCWLKAVLARSTVSAAAPATLF